jgi:heme-degrading monooxygenase HmoA
MYAQVTNLSVPIGKMDEFREIVQNQYFRNVENREGFVMANLLEAIDDPHSAQIITYWDSQRAIENARRTGSLQETVQMLASYMPGVRLLRQGYIVTVNTEDNRVTA